MATISEFINKIGFKVKDEDVNKVNNTISEIKNTATKILGAIGIGFSLTAINGLVEEFTRVNDKIKSSNKDLSKQAEIQQKILDSANRTRTQYADTAKIVSNLTKENENLFGSVDEAIQFVDTATMLFKTSGKTNEEIAGLWEAINKSFAKGYVDSETLSQLLEKSPEAVELLNRKLGTTSDQLEKMASDGRFTVEDLKAAFVENADEIEAKFGNVRATVTEGLTVIRNKWGLWLTDTNEMLGLTNIVSKAMVNGFDAGLRVITKVRTGVIWLSEKLGGMENVLKLVLLSAGTMFLAFNFSRISAGLAKIVTFLKGINYQAVLMAAKIILLALLIDDLINFFQGNDSLFGTMLEKAGVDVDKFRNDCIKIWSNIKTALSAIWEGIKEVGIPIFEAIWEGIKKVFSAIGDILEKIAPKFADLISQLANGDLNTEEWKELGEIIAIAVPIIIALVLAFKAYSAIMAIVNAVMAASPITWIVLAIVALIAAIALLIANWDKVKEAAAKCWNWIKGAWGKVADWFKTKIIQPIVGFFTSLWDSIVGIFSSVGNWFSSIFRDAYNGIVNAFKSIGSFFSGIWDSIVGLFSEIGTAIGDGIGGAFKAVVNSIISFAENTINGFIKAINKAIGVINKIPGVEIPKLKLLEIPKLAQGGYVEANRPTQVIIGDNRNEGEIVSPISKMRNTFLDALSAFAASRFPRQAAMALTAGSTSVRNITQNVEINNTFKGDTAIQRSASTAMQQSAADVTSTLARGLEYVR